MEQKLAPGSNPPMSKRASYWDYIRVDQLLNLQDGIEREAELSDDEVRFIVIHQVDELWFKLVLRELVTARDQFAQEHVPETKLTACVAALERIQAIYTMAAQHFQLMETMATRDYLRFRDKLSPASGFQSAQMREIEILMGLDPEDRIPFGHENSYLDALKGDEGEASKAWQQVQKRIQDTPTLKNAVYAWLGRTPIRGSKPGDPDDEAAVRNFIDEFLQGHQTHHDEVLQHNVKVQALAGPDAERLKGRLAEELAQGAKWLNAEDTDEASRPRVRRLRAAVLFIESHRDLPLLSWPSRILDAAVAAEQAMLVFRQRHARMVERVIGKRVGTGGSAGVAYLDQTALEYRVFKDLWAARTLLLHPDRVPSVGDRDYYDLKAGS